MHRYFEAQDKAGFLASVAPEVRGIATRGELGAGRAMIEALPKLEVISVYGVGYDAVDLAACRERGIRVTNTPDVLTKDVADLGVAMMMVQSRGMIGAEKWVRDGSWEARGLYPLKHRVFGKKAGVLGLGRIGYEVAKRLSGFDMDIAYCDVTAKGLCTGLALHRRSGGPGAARRLPFRDTRRLRANPPHRWPRGDRGGGAGRA